MLTVLVTVSVSIWAIVGLAILVTVAFRLCTRPARVRAEARETAAHAAWITQLKEKQP